VALSIHGLESSAGCPVPPFRFSLGEIHIGLTDPDMLPIADFSRLFS
jgi:hypothetical protein